MKPGGGHYCRVGYIQPVLESVLGALIRGAVAAMPGKRMAGRIDANPQFASRSLADDAQPSRFQQ